MAWPIFCLIFGLFIQGCSDSSSPPQSSHALKGEFIFRRHNEMFEQIEPMKPQKRGAYPWEEEKQGSHPRITKYFFRCRGCILNPVHITKKGNETVPYYDCGGMQKHSLPLRGEKEFIYPILIDILNYLQEKTGKKVVITCGHCCPEHNAYLDPWPSNQASKHMLGAEVDFYVQDMEFRPQSVVDLILTYYQVKQKYTGLKDFETFNRYEKEDRKVSTPPWYNKEIFIKLFQKDEGRDFDNRHPYPYVSIQVRYDWEDSTAVVYSWDKAFRNFHRH